MTAAGVKNNIIFVNRDEFATTMSQTAKHLLLACITLQLPTLPYITIQEKSLSGTAIKALSFSSDFETLFTKQSPREILGLNFEDKTVYLNYNFPI